MTTPLASYPTLRIASAELGRVFNLIGEGARGKISLGKHKTQTQQKNKRKKIVFDILNKGLSLEEERIVRKILKDSAD